MERECASSPPSFIDVLMNTTYDYIIKNGKLVWANPDVYLESLGSQSTFKPRLDTDYIMSSKDGFEVKCNSYLRETAYGNNTLFGTWLVEYENKPYIQTIMFHWNNPDDVDFYYGNNRYDGKAPYVSNTILSGKLNGNKYAYYVDNEIKWETDALDLQHSFPLSLFVLKTCYSTEYNYNYPFYGRVYYFKFFDKNNFLIHNLVPVPQGLKIGDYTVPSNGMWDIVEQKFYGNAGTGSFNYQGVFTNVLYINDEPTYKRIIKYNKYITTKRKKGGPRYLIDNPKISGRGPVLLGSYDYALGLKANEEDFLFYKSDHDLSKKFSFSINTTLNPTNPNDSTYIIPIWKYTPSFTFLVDWGDNTNTIFKSGEEITLANRTHTYSTPGSYTITLYSDSGVMPPFVNSIMSGPDYNYNNYKLISINSSFIKYDEDCIHPSVQGALENAPNLFYIPDYLLRFNGHLDNYRYMFKGDTGLKSIPKELFSYVTKNSYFEETFEGCTGLKNIPYGLMVNIVPFNTARMFANCTGLEDWISMEAIFGYGNWNTKTTIDVHEMFYNCSNSKGNAQTFVDYVGENRDDSKKSNALHGCTLWDNYYKVDTIWTGFPTPDINYLNTDAAKKDWLMADNDNILLTE